MWEKAHKLITEKACEIAGVNAEVTKYLLDNIMRPDDDAQNNVLAFIHHYAIKGEIGNAPEMINKCFHLSKVSGYYDTLAYALHYIQDICVPAHCNAKISFEMHKEMERLIDTIIEGEIFTYEYTHHSYNDIEKYMNKIAEIGSMNGDLYIANENIGLLSISIINALDASTWLLKKYFE